MHPYNNYKLEVDFQIPQGWIVMDHEEAMINELGITPEEAVPTAFIAVNAQPGTKMQDVQYVTVTHDMAIYETEAEYVEGLKANIREFTESGAQVSQPQTTRSPNNIRVDKIIAQVASITMVQYFFYINELLVCATAEIKKPSDEIDKIVQNIVFSAKKEEK